MRPHLCVPCAFAFNPDIQAREFCMGQSSFLTLLLLLRSAEALPLLCYAEALLPPFFWPSTLLRNIPLQFLPRD